MEALYAIIDILFYFINVINYMHDYMNTSTYNGLHFPTDIYFDTLTYIYIYLHVEFN